MFTGRDEIKGWSDNEFIGATGVLTPRVTTVDGDRLASMTIREG